MKWKIGNCLWFVKVSLKDIIIYYKPPTQRNWVILLPPYLNGTLPTHLNLSIVLVDLNWLEFVVYSGQQTFVDSAIAIWILLSFVVLWSIIHSQKSKVKSVAVFRYRTTLNKKYSGTKFLFWIYRLYAAGRKIKSAR